MASNVSTLTDPKCRRIMIITADESIIDQIERSNDASLFTQIALESGADNSRSIGQQTKVHPSRQKNTTSHGSLTCVVCASLASGYNFGAIACESCKAFFRRNCHKHPATLHCHHQGACEITSKTRRACPACRLDKCFNSGMQRDRLLTDEQRTAKRRKIEENRTLALHSTSKTNEEQPQLSPSTMFDDLLTSIDTNILLLNDFTDLLSSPLPHLQQALLSSADLERLETISLLYQKRIEHAARDGLPWDPSKQTINFLQVLNSHSVPVMRLLSFFKQIPEFNQLNVDDKVTLIKYNFMTVLGINVTLSYNVETHEIIENDTDVPCNMQFFQLVHGYNIIIQAHKIFRSLLDIKKYDQNIIRLVLIVLIFTQDFSTAAGHDEVILIDKMAVYRAQNYYIELLWKYMETVYEYEKAIHLFSKLIFHVMSWKTVQEKMRNNIVRTLSPNDIDELLPVMKSVLRIS